MSFLLRRGTKKNLRILGLVVALLYLLHTITSNPHGRRALSRSRLEHLQQIRKSDSDSAPKQLRWGAPGKPNVVDSQPNKALHYKECVPLPGAPIRKAKICIYPRKYDRRDSEYLNKGKLLEKDQVKEMTDVLKRDHDMQLVDLGSNLGVYTLSAASWGAPVLAVDMYPNNIRQLQTSASESGLSDYVTLVNNGLYSDHRTINAPYMRALIDDGSYLHIPKPNFKNWGTTDENQGSNTVSTVCIDDLMPLIETSRVFLRLNLDGLEAIALQCAFRFFAKVDVRVVQMRWLDKTPEEIDVLNEFMQLEWGFKASRSASQYIPANTKIPTAARGYVYWIKVPDSGKDNEEEEEEEDEDEEEAGEVEGKEESDYGQNKRRINRPGLLDKKGRRVGENVRDSDSLNGGVERGGRMKMRNEQESEGRKKPRRLGIEDYVVNGINAKKKMNSFDKEINVKDIERSVKKKRRRP